VGAQLVGALPGPGGLNAGQMLAQPMKALLLLGVEPVLDAPMPPPPAPLAGVGPGGGAHALQGRAADVADVLLPIAPFTETSGSFVNAEGRLQSFHGVVKPLGDARPAWKVLRVLGNLLGLPGFDQESATRCARRRWATWLHADVAPGQRTRTPVLAAACAGLQRVADVPIYATDAMVRRAPSLQTADAKGPVAGLPQRRCGKQLGLQPVVKVRWRRATRQRRAARALKTPRWRPRRVRIAAATRAPRRWARCSAPSRSRRPDRHVRHPATSRGACPGRHAVAGGLEPDQDRRRGAAADGVRGLPDAVGTQGIGWTQIRPAPTASAPGAC
jgi:hypothetical protein